MITAIRLQIPSDRPPGYVAYKPSAPIGRLGATIIEIVDKPRVTENAPRRSPSHDPAQPFEVSTTITNRIR